MKKIRFKLNQILKLVIIEQIQSDLFNPDPQKLSKFVWIIDVKPDLEKINKSCKFWIYCTKFYFLN